MSDAVIEVENLGKRYRIGERERYSALRDVLSRPVSAWSRRRERKKRPEIWALKDVSFEVQRGEVVGLIGRNGAGKSTLLKVLSRITKPTEGRAEIRGRVGSLLEVGTGFHPELTGRENVFLNGAILGMSKREIQRKFDEIVAFSEVEKFLDTPLKYYSSGMQVRLAFAVAAHLEPEILFVDEVLSVGDVQFQKKCLGKMGEVSRQGRTIIFVSHQMNQIRRLCEDVIWLDLGRFRQRGRTAEVVGRYELEMVSGTNVKSDPSRCFLGWSIEGSESILHDGMTETSIRLNFSLKVPISRGHLGVNILTETDVLVGGWSFDEVNLGDGLHYLIMTVPFLPLKPGIYWIRGALYNGGNNLSGGELIESWQSTQPLVVDAEPRTHSQDRWSGLLNIPAELSVRSGDSESTLDGARAYQSTGLNIP